MSWKIKYSTWFDAELERLEQGTTEEKARARKFITAAKKVENDPLHHDFRKTLPDNYKAVHIFQQDVAFFRIYRIDSGDYIFFVWMNDENSLHATGSKSDAYQVFRDKLKRGEIETFTDPALALEPEFPNFQFDGNWGDSYCYVRYNKTCDLNASLGLVLYKESPYNYRIDSITPMQGDWGMAWDLLNHLSAKADPNGVHLHMTFLKTTEDAEELRRVLMSQQFKMTMEDADEEVWERAPKLQ